MLVQTLGNHSMFFHVFSRQEVPSHKNIFMKSNYTRLCLWWYCSLNMLIDLGKKSHSFTLILIAISFYNILITTRSIRSMLQTLLITLTLQLTVMYFLVYILCIRFSNKPYYLSKIKEKKKKK